MWENKTPLYFWQEFYDHYVPYSLTIPEKSLHSLLLEKIRTNPSYPALLWEGYSVRNADLDRYSGGFARWLVLKGVEPGERVALILPNLPHYPICYLGALRAGAIVVGLNPLYKKEEFLYCLKDTQPKVVVTLDLLWQNVGEAIEEAKIPWVVVGSPADFLPFHLSLAYRWVKGKKIPIPSKVTLFRQAVSTEPVFEAEPKNLEAPAVFIYTGGTTGFPKAAMLSHRNLVANLLQCDSWFPRIEPKDNRLLAALPFFHSFGLTVGLHLGIYRKATLILHPKFHLRTLIEEIRKYEPILFPGVPSMFAALNRFASKESFSFPSLKICISGGAPLPLEVLKEFERITGAYLVEGFGLTESSPVTHVNPLFGRRKIGSIGVPLPETEAKIVDVDTGERELPPGEPGELIIRGPQVMLGYWGKPEETAQVLRKGFLYTGDIGYMDKEGFFYIVDRKKDMLIVEGFNVYPREIEEVLYQHPKVAEAAVVGEKDPLRGERPKAFIVLKENQKATPEEIIRFCSEKLAHFKVPRSVEFRSELPKSAIGKILRRELRPH
ncbi:MAG: long-chain-fatty-acid--CoA ligase [bacterium JZ-2024 1]